MWLSVTHYVTDLLNNQLLRSFIDSIPIAVLLMDTLLLGEFKYFKSLIRAAIDKHNQMKIRELCFCKPLIGREHPKSYPYSIYNELCPTHPVVKSSSSHCPIFKDLTAKIEGGSLRSPKLSKEDIIDQIALIGKIFRDNDSLSIFLRNRFERDKLHEWDLANDLDRLIEELNKIIDDSSLLILTTTQNKASTAQLINFFKKIPYIEDFNPLQLNRLVLQEGYPDEIKKYICINPLWRLINEIYVIKSHQTQFFEAIAVQFATLYLSLQVEPKSYSSDFGLLFLVLMVIMILLIIWNEKISGGPNFDWFNNKNFRILCIISIWIGTLITSFIFIQSKIIE